VTHRVATLVAGVALAGSAVAGCASDEPPPATGSPAVSSRASAGPVDGPSRPPRRVGPPADPACASLYARLQQVTAVLGTGSELITNSVDKAELGRRIADERRQLSRAAELMARKPIPPGVRDADRRLVVALHVLSGDFGRAAAPAARGDFRAAAAAMRDDATVRRIVAASEEIEDACG
jgi:hypothetical protein